jgi:hypothetical protein
MPSPRYPVRLPPALEAAVQEHIRTAGTPWATRRAESGVSRATIWRYLPSEMGSQGRRPYCIFLSPPGERRSAMTTHLGGEGQRVGCRACDVVFRDRTAESLALVPCPA